MKGAAMGEIHKLAPRETNAEPCPICGKPALPKARPFCSTRCANLDLNRWLTGAYRVPADEAPEDADAVRAEDKSD